MKIGITGHQERDGIDWAWVQSRLEELLITETKVIGYSSLAAGTDQVFARAVLKVGGRLEAVIPIERYEAYFKGAALDEYLRLRTLADVVELKSNKRDEQAFFDAGKWIVKETDRLIAVWDGEQAEGTGGTGDVVRYAASLGKTVCQLNPISRKIDDI